MCFPIFDLIKFTCFGSTFSYHKEILNPPPPRTRTQSSLRGGTRNPRGLTHPAQDSNVYFLGFYCR